MIRARTKTRVATWHRWLGLGLTLPLVGWIVSSAVMMLVTMNAPNGLAGSYRLNPYNSVDVPLDAASITPNALLKRLADEEGIERVFWLRLQSRGPHLWYVARPTPYSLAMVFDARTGMRLDPLPDSLLAVVAGEALVSGRASRIEPVTEYNRYYEVDRVPAVRASIDGEQPATLVLSRDEGRTLRRLNVASERFGWWYRFFHVNQFSDHMLLWTTLLYVCGAGVVLTTVFGYQLFWWRRRPVSGDPITSGGLSQGRRFSARNLHRKLGVAVGGVLSIELLVGAYLWLSLGPLEDPFRGKASFSKDWSAGFATTERLAEPSVVLERVAARLELGRRPVQAIEWRRLGDQHAWVVSPRKDQAPYVFAAHTGELITALPAETAGAIAREEVVGKPRFTYLGTAPQLWMDLNRTVPTYRFRFQDPGQTDVYVSQTTGEVIQRRPYFWRLFGPFLAVHMFSFTGNKTIDMIVLALFQLATLALIATGWRLQFPGARASPVERVQASMAGVVDDPLVRTDGEAARSKA